MPVHPLLLAPAVPLQRLLDEPSPTHSFINRQALAILTADARHHEAGWLRSYLEHFSEGCDWADTGWRNVGHMYDPLTGSGFKGWPNATQMLREYWDLAVGHTRAQEVPKAFFYLGAAAHLVQDLCVPHHAAARMFAGHQQFEAYARRYRHRFAAHARGLYDIAETPEGWVIANAQYTRERYSDCITSTPDRHRTQVAVQDLLPRAQRTTAGFVTYFLARAGVA